MAQHDPAFRKRCDAARFVFAIEPNTLAAHRLVVRKSEGVQNLSNGLGWINRRQERLYVA